MGNSSAAPVDAGGRAEIFGRYVLHAPIARGGMASVHLARLVGAEGFSRLVAAKRLHPALAEDAEFVAMFLEEARIASKITHPNVVPVLDVVQAGNEVLLVQEYAHGVPLDRLAKVASERREPVPVRVAVAVAAGVLAGLHAAHETKDERGRPLDVVHRDVSPQNVLVSLDGVPRLLDFGIAKARSSTNVTREGHVKGKIAYMAPEQLNGAPIRRAADIYALGVVLWELLVGRRMHAGRPNEVVLGVVLAGNPPSIASALDHDGPGRARYAEVAALEPIVMRALASNLHGRFETAADMLEALLATSPAASPPEIARWVKATGAAYLEAREQILAATEESFRSLQNEAPPSAPASSDASGIKPAGHTALAFPPPEVSPPSSLTSPTSPTSPTGAAPSRLTPVLIAALLVLVGVLGGVVLMLLVRAPIAPASATVAPTPAARNASTLAAPAASPAAGREAPSATMLAAAPPAPPRPEPPRAEVTRPTPARPAPRGAAHPPPAATPSPAPPPAVSAPPAPKVWPKPDCNPPFAYEGTKKVYKPGCLLGRAFGRPGARGRPFDAVDEFEEGA